MHQLLTIQLSILSLGKRGESIMNTKKKKSLIYPVLFMTALTLFTTLILAILNQSTLDIVKANQELELRKNTVCF